MQKALLLDTNFSAEPIHNYLTCNGYEVFTCGNNPSDYLARAYKNHIKADYSSITKINDIIERIGIDFVVPGCNDQSYKTCAEINQHKKFFGTDSIEKTLIINNKDKFRNLAIQLDLPIPHLFVSESIKENYPIVVKPVDSYSGRGITIIDSFEKRLFENATQKARQHSRSQSYLVEEYVEGQLYSHSAFLVDGEIILDFIVEEHGSANPLTVDTSKVVHQFDPFILHRIRQDIIKISNHLKLVDGLIHTQFIQKNDKYWLIELTRRCPGDLYAELIQLSTEIDYIEMYIKPFINIRNTPKTDLRKKHFILRHTISEAEDKIFKSIKFNYNLEIEKLVPLASIGQHVMASPFGRIGVLFAKTQSENDLSALLNIAVSRDLYIIS